MERSIDGYLTGRWVDGGRGKTVFWKVPLAGTQASVY